VLANASDVAGDDLREYRRHRIQQPRGQEPPPDKWKLAQLVSKLDDKDKQWAMKQDDIEILRKWAASKGEECHNNAGECGRMADEVAYKILS
jgi:hypothetical protein